MVINMLVRLGYVSISKTLEEKAKFKTINYTNYQKEDEEKSKEKLDNIIKNNLETLNKIIKYNIKNNIHFYRLTSNLIPLATLDEVNFNYTDKYKNLYNEISKNIINNNLRIDMHPSEYTILNTVRSEVLDNTIKILKYHEDIINNLKIKKPIMIVHVGSNTFGKKASLTRFVNNFYKLPISIQHKIAIENDDKTFNVEDILKLCKKLNVPMILDVHHNKCNPSEKPLEFYLQTIFNTWKTNTPKIHFSSPKNNTKKDIRTHHNYINVDEFILFLEKAKYYTEKLDIMLEAKMKDEALFRLIRELKFQTNYTFIDETSFIVK